MSTLKHRTLTLVAVLAVAAAGCSGDKGPAGADGSNGNDGAPGANGVNGGASTGLVIAVTGVTANSDSSVSVRFTLKDDQGYPVDLAGRYSKNKAFTPRFALTKITQAADGTVLPYTVLTTSGSVSQDPAAPAPDPATVTVNPTAVAPATPAVPTTSGALVENGSGNGDYTYTFPTGGMTSAPGTGSNAGKTTYSVAPAVQLDQSGSGSVTHSVWIQASRQTNLNDANDPKGFKATNYEYRFTPAGSGTPLQREIVSTAACYACHNGFKAQSSLASGGFHGYGRNEGPFCNVCHNQARQSGKTNSDGATPAAASSVFVHRIHNAKNLQAKTSGTSTIGYQGSTACSASKPCTCTDAKPCVLNAFDGVTETTYPQDLRNCSACHGGAAQGAQALNNPSRAACGSCHDYVDFTGTVTPSLPFCSVPNAKDANGQYVPCVHTPGAQANDTSCKGCHSPAGGSFYIGDKHVAVAPADAGNIFLPVTSGTVTAGYKDGTLTTCTNASPCTCNPVSPCLDPVKLSLVTVDQKPATGSVQVYVGGTACGTGHAPSLYYPCDCTGATCRGSGNNNTNAAALAAAGMAPAGAARVSYVVKSVSASANHPVITFKLQLDGNDVVFNTKGSGKPELIDNFVGSPSVYFAFAVPQDGIAAPADFNASASAYIKDVWKSGVTTGSQTTGSNAAGATCTVAAPCDCTTSACYAAGKNTLTGPDASGFYTVTIAATTLPTGTGAATMLTGGVGYTYGLTSTPPLTQTNVTGYPYDATTKQGGVIVSAPDQWKTATGFTARRKIVETSRCNNCHEQLGAEPTFHAGQRNDGPTCSFCHNPNRTSSGWSANAKDFIHSIHAGDQRSTPFNWHASSPTEGFWDITFPDQLNHCQACHAPGTYDFSVNAAAVPNLLASTVGQGKYNGDDSTASYAFSPWVSKTTDAAYATASDYGTGYSTSDIKTTVTSGTVTSGTQAIDSATTKTCQATDVDATHGICTCTPTLPCSVTVQTCSLAAPCNAATTTLVTSPIMAACVACHDGDAAKAHMTGNGGSFYQPRSVAAQNVEQCLICHGPQPGAIAPIADVHW